MNSYVITLEFGHRAYIDADYFELEGFYLVLKNKSGERVAAFHEWKSVEKMTPLDPEEEDV